MLHRAILYTCESYARRFDRDLFDDRRSAIVHFSRAKNGLISRITDMNNGDFGKVGLWIYADTIKANYANVV